MAVEAAVPSTSWPLVEWGAAAATLPGQVELGDGYVVKPFPNGLLIAVVDGLGHGGEAAIAARRAATTLEAHAAESVITLANRCHSELRNTRGVVMSLASLNGRDGTMTWLGLGNVEGVLMHVDRSSGRRPESLLLRGGVVGSRLPELRAEVLPLARGDTLIFATDGVRSGFADGLNLADAPQRIADRILVQHHKGTDDALVLVARYLGSP